MSIPLFPDRFSAWIETELRRQGVSPVEEWRDRIVRHSRLDAPAVSSADEFQGCSFRVDLTGQHVTDKVAVAVVESLLRVYTTLGNSLDGALVGSDRALRGDWSVSFRGNELGDAASQHLTLLVQTCQCLSRLDLRGNLFSAEAKSDMLGVMSGVPCDVVLGDGPVALSTHSSSDSEKTPAQPPKKSEPEQAAVAQPTSTAPLATAHVPVSAVKGASPEATSSIATSKVSYASGSAEALRRRREGLFGKARTASPSTTGVPSVKVVVPPTPPAQLAPEAKQDAPSHDGEGISLSPVSPHDGPGQSIQSQADASPHNDSEPSPRGVLFASTPPRQTMGRAPIVSSSPFHDSEQSTAHDATGISRDRAVHAQQQQQRQREPFYGGAEAEADDRNDRLDLTSNLNPILDSVLDLSAAVAKDGRTLRAPELFGEAESVWDVIDAYEEAVEQSALGGDASTMDPDTSARLPPSLLNSRTAFTALTVLNLSKNNLKELHVFPATLLRLDVSSNQLVRLSGLEKCKMLTVLNARRNDIQEICGLERNVCLAHLFLGHNAITLVEGLAHLLLLETLDLSFNRLRSQASLRALSLTSSLRHLLIRGNPVMEKLQQGFKVVLRNLCPSLLVIDDVKLSHSRFTDGQQMYHNALRQPDSTASSASGNKGVSRASSRAGAGGRREGAAARSGQTFLPTGNAPSLNREASVLGAREAERPDRNAMNLLHMLTRGVTAPTGYGDGAKVVQTAKAMETRAVQQTAAEKRRKEREVTEGGAQLRTVMMKKLAEASKTYLEATLVERMTAAQHVQSQSAAYASSAAPEDSASPFRDAAEELPSSSPLPAQPAAQAQVPAHVRPSLSSARASAGASLSASKASAVRRPSRGRQGTYGAVVDPLEDSPLPDVMGYTAVPPSVLAASTVKPQADPTPRSTTRSVSHDARRSTMPPGKAQTGFDVVLAPYERNVSRRHVHQDPTRSPRSTRSSRARAQSTAQRRESYNNNVGEAPPADVTLDAIYECYTDEEGTDDKDQGHKRNGVTSSGVVGSSGGYATLHAAPSAFTAPGTGGRAQPKPRYIAAAAKATFQEEKYEDDDDDDDELAVSPIPHRSSALMTSAAESARRGSPALRPPPPMAVTTPFVRSDAGLVRARKATPYLVGSKKRIPREARAASSPSRGVEVGEPLRVDISQAQRVQTWRDELTNDVGAVQMTLKTIVKLLEAQKQSGLPLAEHSHELPRTYLDERKRSVAIVEESGMLQDITVPAEVALYYGLSQRELEGGASSRSAPRGGQSRSGTGSRERDAKKADSQGWSREASERDDVLRNIRVMGDAKTCLRYLLLLISGGKERLLQEYVAQIKSIV